MDRRKNLSPEVREARAAARAETRAVRAYLEGLESSRKPRRSKSPRQELTAVQEKLQTESDQIQKLHLIQRRIDAERRIANAPPPVDMAALEEMFVKVAKSYSTRRGVSYKAWREMGVPASVLVRSAISRTRS